MNRFIVTDPNRCIGCYTCEIACVLAQRDEDVALVRTENFTPKLKVVKNGLITAPIICRQCVGAPCVNACKYGALTQGKDSIVADQSKCIGCNECVMACPYGAVSLVQHKVPLQPTATGEVGYTYHAEVLKCGLCEDRANGEGPACVEACPTEALSIVEPSALKAEQQKRQMAALQATRVMMRTKGN